ncbi:MAG: DUF402 domain-containing protein [Thermoplasmata archaeon]
MVKVRYHRTGKETREWKQKLLADDEDMIVSSFIFRLSKPFTPLGEEPLINDGYYGVLFDLLDKWFNVVKIFEEDKTLVGYYSDIRTPPFKCEGGYEAEDLFVDFWVETDGTYYILDMEEFEVAEIDDKYHKKVKETIDKLKDMIDNDEYPPQKVKEFELTADEIG